MYTSSTSGLIWSRRDYCGSTPYTEVELEDIREGKKTFLDKVATHNAWFMEHFIKHENTPKKSADSKTGEFVLMGWSFGNVFTW